MDRPEAGRWVAQGPANQADLTPRRGFMIAPWMMPGRPGPSAGWSSTSEHDRRLDLDGPLAATEARTCADWAQMPSAPSQSSRPLLVRRGSAFRFRRTRCRDTHELCRVGRPRARRLQRLPARLVTTPQTVHSFTRQSSTGRLARPVRTGCWVPRLGSNASATSPPEAREAPTLRPRRSRRASSLIEWSPRR